MKGAERTRVTVLRICSISADWGSSVRAPACGVLAVTRPATAISSRIRSPK